MLHEKHTNGTTPQLLLALIGYLANIGSVVCKLQESVSALKCILERNVDTNESIKSLYAEEIVRRKHQSRSNVFRCIGSTLLVKGLEFDHAIILRSQDWQRSWGNYKDLYVALTRGSRSVTLIDLH